MPNNSQRSNNVIQATVIDEPHIIIGETLTTEDEKKEQIKKLNEKIEALNKKLTNMKKENKKKENCILKYKSEIKNIKDKKNELNIISGKHNLLGDSVIKMKNSVDIMKNENDNLLKENDNLLKENTYLIKRYRTRDTILNKEVTKVCDLNEQLEKENIDLKKKIIDIGNKCCSNCQQIKLILENQ